MSKHMHKPLGSQMMSYIWTFLPTYKHVLMILLLPPFLKMERKDSKLIFAVHQGVLWTNEKSVHIENHDLIISVYVHLLTNGMIFIFTLVKTSILECCKVCVKIILRSVEYVRWCFGCITSLQLWALNIPRAAMTREFSFYFEDEAFLRLQAELHSGLPDHPFKVRCSPPGHV